MPRRSSVLSLVTLVWVVSLLYVGTTHTRGTWPVSRSTMFSHSATEHVEPVLHGLTADGRLPLLTAEGYGLTAPQLRNWLALRLGSEVDDADRPVLAELGRLWTQAHPGDRLAVVELHIRTTPLDDPDAAASERRLTWTADAPT